MPASRVQVDSAEHLTITIQPGDLRFLGQGDVTLLDGCVVIGPRVQVREC